MGRIQYLFADGLGPMEMECPSCIARRNLAQYDNLAKGNVRLANEVERLKTVIIPCQGCARLRTLLRELASNTREAALHFEMTVQGWESFYSALAAAEKECAD
jgi:hypothetical protein